VTALKARGTGTICVFLGTPFTCLWTGVYVSFWNSPRIRHHLVDELFMLTLGLYALSFLVCGILYVVGGARIRTPNRRWELTLLIAAAFPLGLVALATIAWILFGQHAWSLMGYGLHLVLMWQLGSIIVQTASLRRT
jgi:hypothetical protein